MSKVFIYTDPEFELDHDNVFISGVYMDAREFLRENSGMRLLAGYDADKLKTHIDKGLERISKTKRKPKSKKE